jgi:uncharacterized membrane protein YfcA
VSPLNVVFGAIVGLSLGLTGGGGAIFAVPLLVYGAGMPAQEAVGVSLASVGATSLVGFLYRWRLGEVEIRPGILFAVSGMLGAPLGTYLSELISESTLLFLFAGLMVVVAGRMWRQARLTADQPSTCSTEGKSDGPACRRDALGSLVLNSHCAGLLLLLGFATGVVSGLFGVGGGFVIVPALVLFSGMSIHRAVGTSLMVISLVSASGVLAQLWMDKAFSPTVAAQFVGGGIAGLLAGQRLARRLKGPTLQKVFAVAILLVAAFVIVRNLLD